MKFTVKWADLKTFASERSLSIQWLVSNNLYWLAAIDGQLELVCQLPIKSPPTDDQNDFETNFKNSGNLSPNSSVTTVYESDDKDLKLAKSFIILNNSTSGYSTIKIPGDFGSTTGRYVAGGYAISADYDIDDYVTVHIEDTDRLIAWAIAQAEDPNASQPISDDDIKQMGVLPLIGQPMPNYPIVKSYTDDELDVANQGWFFWPLVMGDGLPPAGECEIEPIGGYGFLPSGMYIVINYFRATKTTGRLNLNYYWGKKE